MPNKCGIVNCTGNYDDSTKCRIFKLPKDDPERQKWLAVIPPRQDLNVSQVKSFFVCEKHWPENPPLKKLPGGTTRPAVAPSIFDVPASCRPTPRPPPRPAKQENRQLEIFMDRDRIKSFCDFVPDKEIQKKYENVVITKSSAMCAYLFMSSDFHECKMTVVVENKSTLCSPLVCSAYKSGVRVPLGTILNPNNGLNSYSQFDAVVHTCLNYTVPLEEVLRKVVTELQAQETGDKKKAKKLDFITNNLKLLADKKFTVKDYCFAVESFPHCNYEALREYLVLPSKRKVQAVISTVNVKDIISKTFAKVQKPQQKNVVLLVDEIKIRPTVAFSGGVLSGMAKNDPNAKATSMLCVMVKCLCRGPSIMVSVTPVHKLTAAFQFDIVKQAATVVEQAGGTVLGSITDNHKINQCYCKMFHRPSESECPATATHPLDGTRTWYLLFDTVHLLKCIRNNWISEACQKLTFDQQVTGSFSDIRKLYDAEKENILKTSPLTNAAVRPSKLQLQNVQHVLKVFNEKVEAALRLQKCGDTADFVQFVLNWWNVVNVSSKGQDVRLNDPHRHVQDHTSTNLSDYHQIFQRAPSGHGKGREQCVTHDTKKALVQTMQGLASICVHLLTHAGFKYVLLREVQSDRIEGEFSVYRQSTGANAFMTSGDVLTACKKRLARHAASYLEAMEVTVETTPHTCVANAIDAEDAAFIEDCTEPSLSIHEESSAAYVAGWLEMKCAEQLNFNEEDEQVPTEISAFIKEVSRGSLKIPHQTTFDLVRCGLAFVTKARHRACCSRRLRMVLQVMEDYKNLNTCDKLRKHLANVLLSGLHNLERDQQKNAVLLQTSIKKARLSD